MGPVMQLMVTDTLPPSGIYTSLQVEELVGNTRTHILNVFLPTKKKHEESPQNEMALVIGHDVE